MNAKQAKEIVLSDYLAHLGFTPLFVRGYNLWYLSPFRNETNPSFKVNTSNNLWYDFGIATGGTIIKFAMLYYNTNDLSYVLHILSGEPLKQETKSLSSHPQESLTPFENILVYPLTHPGLMEYIQERKINPLLAIRFCKEIHFRYKDKAYFAIGFSNQFGGYEIRNRYFKGTIAPKDITLIQEGKDICYLFEGFMDYLSFLTLEERKKENKNLIYNRDHLILNSLSFLSKAIPRLNNYRELHLFFDNDEAGQKAVKELTLNSGSTIIDCSTLYRGFKDVNDFLCQKKIIHALKPEVGKLEDQTQAPFKKVQAKPQNKPKLR